MSTWVSIKRKLKNVSRACVAVAVGIGMVLPATAYAGDGGGGSGSGSGGSGDSSTVVWTYREDFGAATNANVRAAMQQAAPGIQIVAVGGNNPDKSINEALQKAVSECQSRAGASANCRLVGVGFVHSTGTNSFTGASGSHTSQQWFAPYLQNIVPNTYYRNGLAYQTSRTFSDGVTSVDSIVNREATSPNIRSTSVIVLVLADNEPFQPAFQPSLSTNAPKTYDKGQTVTDQVTLGVSDGSYIGGVSLKADGYYFEGAAGNILREISVDGNNAGDYVNRVKQSLGEPTATASVTFTGAGTQTATAMKNGQPYTSPGNGTFGTWLWVIPRDTSHITIGGTLTGDPLSYVKADTIDNVGKPNETNVHRQTFSEWSMVAEPHAETGAELWDTITVNGFPKDLGDFKGNSAYGMCCVG